MFHLLPTIRCRIKSLRKTIADFGGDQCWFNLLISGLFITKQTVHLITDYLD